MRWGFGWWARNSCAVRVGTDFQSVMWKNGAILPVVGGQETRVHSDLKPANVFVQETGSTVTVKIGDVGLARRVSHAMPATGGTAVDMWALGCVCVELECKVVAFPSASEESMINNIFSKVGTQPAPGGSPWKTLTMLPNYAQLRSMGKRKG